MKKLFGVLLILSLFVLPGFSYAETLSVDVLDKLENVTFGTKSDEVKELQNLLYEKGFMQKKHITGYFGSITSAALKEYQASTGIGQTGVVDSSTLSKLGGGYATSTTATSVSSDDFIKNTTVTAIATNTADKDSDTGSKDCSPGDKYSSLTGKLCTLSVSLESVCLPGHLFNSMTGEACPEKAALIITDVEKEKVVVVEETAKENAVEETKEISSEASVPAQTAQQTTNNNPYNVNPLQETYCGVDSFYLEGTLRDFTNAHPDFEREDWSTPGIITNPYVYDDLGADGKPKAARPSFVDWYRDVSGVNQSMPYNITFTNSGFGGEYVFEGYDFFPIDGQLLGNEGEPHNQQFTYEVHTKLKYRPGQVLRAVGDDDVFIFYNGKKILDIGGVHPSTEDYVVLSEKKGQELGLVAGEVYDLDIFFAERHTVASTFKLYTGIKKTLEGQCGLVEAPSYPPRKKNPPSMGILNFDFEHEERTVGLNGQPAHGTNPNITVTATVVYNMPVVVTGSPQVQVYRILNNEYVTNYVKKGVLLDYVSGSGTNTLTFTYTTQPNDETVRKDYFDKGYIVTNGGSVKPL